MGWEGQTAGILDANEKPAAVTAAVKGIAQTAEMCRKAGLPVEIVSCGGTGTYWITAAQPGITEIQAGGGVFCDVHYAKDFAVEHPYALTVMTTVTSRPTPNRIICDAGKKTMSSDASMPEPLGLGAGPRGAALGRARHDRARTSRAKRRASATGWNGSSAIPIPRCICTRKSTRHARAASRRCGRSLGAARSGRSRAQACATGATLDSSGVAANRPSSAWRSTGFSRTLTNE